MYRLLAGVLLLFPFMVGFQRPRHNQQKEKDQHYHTAACRKKSADGSFDCMHDGLCCRRCPLPKLAHTPLCGACGLHDHFPLQSTLHGLPRFLRRLCRCSLDRLCDFFAHGGFYRILLVGCGSVTALTGLDLWTINFTGRNSSLLYTRSSSVAIQYVLCCLTLFHYIPDSFFPPLLQWGRLR